MMKKILFILCICSSLNGFARQFNVIINAYVLDRETNQPVPYVNIGFVGKSIGTVSNSKGKFRLVYDEFAITAKDRLQISALGYESINVTAKQLESYLKNSNEILLKPKPEQLTEVFISDEKRKEVTIGNAENIGAWFGYWKDKIALGGEIASRLKIKHDRTKLLEFKFNIVENGSDSIKIRLNLYNYNKRYPQEKILKTNVFRTLSQKEGVYKIDLEPYNIFVNDDVVIGIELIEVYGDSIGFAIGAKRLSGSSFLRYISQDTWERHAVIGMNFEVLTSIPLRKNEVYLPSRKSPNRLTLYWDESKSIDASYKSEYLEFISTYLKEVKTLDLELIRFANSINLVKRYQIKNGDSSELIEDLNQTIYSGAVNYSQILKFNAFNADAILLVTEANTLFEELAPEINIPIFCLNANPYANHEVLQKVAFYADGHYINLNIAKRNEAVGQIFFEVDDKMDYTINKSSKNTIEGKIFSPSGAIQGASVRVKNTFVEAQSDVEGFFNIEAKEDDILVVNYMGMLKKEVQVVSNETVAILLKPDGELLDEVVVKGKKKQEANIETGYGKKNEDALGYAVNTITADEIGPQYNNLADLIVGRFAGVSVAGLNFGGSTPKFIIRGGGGSLKIAYAMFDIDGNIYDSSQFIPEINVQQIQNITILKSITATNRYGSMGQGGAIVIKTKALVSGNAEKKVFNSALVTGNDYDEGNLLQNDSIKKPDYLMVLESATNFNEAKELFERQKRESQFLSIPYYIDVADYFLRWDQAYAFNVLTTIAAIADANPKALRALAFKLEVMGKTAEAQLIYERILELRPQHEQPYRDLTRMYAINGDYEKAMRLYKQVLSDNIEGVKFYGLEKIIANELMHLLAHHKSKVNFKGLPNDFLTAKFKKDIRIVFEWSDPNIEFEFQFVNPQKKYFTWSHSKHENRERLLDEITYGYNTEEFVIDDADFGEWLINIRSLSEESLTNPTYLKYTVFTNYGLPNETKSVKVVKLYQHSNKMTLDKILYKK